MKATPRQKTIIQEVENQITFWRNTNDLDSPTHYCDIEEEARKLEDDASLTEEQRIRFENIMGDLLDFIKTKK